jgi:altronate hydrolase
VKENSPRLIHVHPHDNVAVALADIEAGSVTGLAGGELTAHIAVPKGHKIAVADVREGDALLKFGFPFARATSNIMRGDHVHVHNAATALEGSGEYRYAPLFEPAAGVAGGFTFEGYRRADGRVGTRNEIWIIPTVGCVARTAERIAAAASKKHGGKVDGIYALTHPFGCSQLGDDLSGTRNLLAALACHPNAGGVLIIGLGCESNQLDAMQAAAGDALRPCRTLVAQQVGDETEEGLALIDQLVAEAALATREPCPLSSLVLGVKCGGSDGLSGLTANPLVGRMSDAVTAAGGTAILTEIPEIFGAEHLLMQRAADENVFNGIVDLVNRFKRHFTDHGQPVSENPSPGNIAGGITTLEEKSLGAVQKGGHAIVTDVIGYGQRVSKAGLTLLEAPGNDAVSSTALAAAGANIILFTTGRGTPLGFPVPTVKIASNSELANRKPGWIDFDAGAVLTGGMEATAEALLTRVCAIASGQVTAAENNGEREIAIWKRGVTL